MKTRRKSEKTIGQDFLVYAKTYEEFGIEGGKAASDEDVDEFNKNGKKGRGKGGTFIKNDQKIELITLNAYIKRNNPKKSQTKAAEKAKRDILVYKDNGHEASEEDIRKLLESGTKNSKGRKGKGGIIDTHEGQRVLITKHAYDVSKARANPQVRATDKAYRDTIVYENGDKANEEDRLTYELNYIQGRGNTRTIVKENNEQIKLISQQAFNNKKARSNPQVRATEKKYRDTIVYEDGKKANEEDLLTYELNPTQGRGTTRTIITQNNEEKILTSLGAYKKSKSRENEKEIVDSIQSNTLTPNLNHNQASIILPPPEINNYNPNQFQLNMDQVPHQYSFYYNQLYIPSLRNESLSNHQLLIDCDHNIENNLSHHLNNFDGSRLSPFISAIQPSTRPSVQIFGIFNSRLNNLQTNHSIIHENIVPKL